VAGYLTLRASGNLNFLFKASLSDGFSGATFASPLLAANALLPANAQDWSYQLVAGADFTAADPNRVQPLVSLAANTGSILFGTNATALPTATGSSLVRLNIVPNFFQVIRTGTGNINLVAGRDVQLLDPLAAIYTAGVQAAAMANFAVPNLNYQNGSPLGSPQAPIYAAQYTLAGGNVTIDAQHDITDLLLQAGVLVANSTRELPSNWLYRQGYVVNGQFAASTTQGSIQSTSWWVDFSNFYEDVGALGGGNVTLTAGHDVSNIDASVPSNARMPAGTPNAANVLELGGGDVEVTAGNNINGGVYYVERGTGDLSAGNSILTNSTRAALPQGTLIGAGTPDSSTWLPTTLFAGNASFNVSAYGNLLLGAVANPFLLPQGINNSFYEKSYFTTYASTDAVDVSSLVGSVTLRDNPDGGAGSLFNWYENVLFFTPNVKGAAQSQPWLRLDETNLSQFATVAALMPPTLQATAFTGDIDLNGSLTLAPSPTGTVALVAAGSINGLQINGVNNPLAAQSSTNPFEWGSATINLSDADPTRLPGIATPLSLAFSSTSQASAGGLVGSWDLTPAQGLLTSINQLFGEIGSIEGTQAVIQTQQAQHASGPLHANDSVPVFVYAAGGNISGLTLFTGKPAQIVAGADITDVSLYLQNNKTSQISLVAAGRDLIAYDPNSPLLTAAQAAGNSLSSGASAEAGDIQIGGPGSIEVLAGRNFNLGIGPNGIFGTAVGLTSIGNARNPNLGPAGASIIAGAGIGVSSGLGASSMGFTTFINEFLNPLTAGAESATYLPDLGALLNLPGDTNAQVWSAFSALPFAQQDALALDIFYEVLRDAGRDHGNVNSSGFGNYNAGFAAIAALFPGNAWSGDISLTSREIKTASGGEISLFAPGGQLTVGFDIAGNQPVDQGILTQAGGNINIFTKNSVIVGTSRIFTLLGGNEIIWSTTGNIAAGASSKTVQSAPPTRVLIDPQSANVQTDLAGLATGGGIGVLASVAGVTPGNVDLIAPAGVVDAGDAGIRSSGNLNISAVQVLNAGNIQVSGSSVGTPAPVAAPSLGGIASASNTSNNTSAGNGQSDAGRTAQKIAEQAAADLPSIITIEVIGYGGGTGT